MDVAAIIVNYRTPDATVDSVTALAREFEGFENPRILVVDNDSRDGSSARLREIFAESVWGGRVEVVDSLHNGGYGYGINLGVRRLLALPTPPRYIYVINPDAVADAGSVKRLAAFMGDHPDAGIVGGLTHGMQGDVQSVAFRFPSVLSEIEMTASFRPLSRLLRDYTVPVTPSDSCEVDWVGGASMLFRREVFSSAGFFDEGFFLYFEEVDFARRARQAGWKVYFVANAGIGHIGSLATGMADESRPMPRYWFQARRRYLVKHHGPLYGAACDAAWICGRAVFVAKNKLLGRAVSGRPRFLRDFIRYSVDNLMKPPPHAEQNAHLPLPTVHGEQ